MKRFISNIAGAGGFSVAAAVLVFLLALTPRFGHWPLSLVAVVAATANASRRIAFEERPASFRSCVVKPFAPCVAFASAGPLTSHAVVLAVLPGWTVQPPDCAAATTPCTRVTSTARPFAAVTDAIAVAPVSLATTTR